jgi:hypothetical protein
MPVTANDAARLFAFPPKEHAGSIAGNASANNGLFGTASHWLTRLPRKRNAAFGLSPLKLFSPPLELTNSG